MSIVSICESFLYGFFLLVYFYTGNSANCITRLCMSCIDQLSSLPFIRSLLLHYLVDGATYKVTISSICLSSAVLEVLLWMLLYMPVFKLQRYQCVLKQNFLHHSFLSLYLYQFFVCENDSGNDRKYTLLLMLLGNTANSIVPRYNKFKELHCLSGIHSNPCICTYFTMNIK